LEEASLKTGIEPLPETWCVKYSKHTMGKVQKVNDNTVTQITTIRSVLLFLFFFLVDHTGRGFTGCCRFLTLVSFKIWSFFLGGAEAFDVGQTETPTTD
jgi:hypothetical protein